MFSPLGNQAYRNLFTAQVMALLGTGMATVALGLLAHDLAGASSGEILGVAFAIKMIAYVGVAPLAGALATRIPARRCWCRSMWFAPGWRRRCRSSLKPGRYLG